MRGTLQHRAGCLCANGGSQGIHIETLIWVSQVSGCNAEANSGQSQAVPPSALTALPICRAEMRRCLGAECDLTKVRICTSRLLSTQI